MTLYSERQGERGAVMILVAIAIVVILGMAAMAVDLGFGLVTKSELQNVADTGSLAGTAALASYYKDHADEMNYTEITVGQIRSTIISQMNAVVSKNTVSGDTASISTSDVEFGKYLGSTWTTLDNAGKGAMGVRVTARRDGTAGSQTMNTTFARVLGIDTMKASASTASTMAVLKKTPPGNALGIPVGIAKAWFTARNSPCGYHDKDDFGTSGHAIRLYPTGPQSGETVDTQKSCAGWHTYTEYPATASRLREVLSSLTSGTYQAPATEAGSTTFNFTGGTIANAFDYMKALYDAQKDASGTWTTVVPVYDRDDCGNPSGAIKIVGFATAWIYSVQPQPNASIDAAVDCNIVDWGEGSNDVDYGTLVGRPGMVQ